jgi:hypothetical protein
MRLGQNLLQQGVGGARVDPILHIPSPEGQLILNGFGFESWSSGYGNGTKTSFNFLVPFGVSKIRCILIGGGGGAMGSYLFDASGGGGGIEFFCDVTAGETLTCLVGKGGVGGSSGNHGNGGASILKRGATVLATGPGGHKSASSGGTTSVTGTGSSFVTNISLGVGGRQANPNAGQSVFLSGAVGHAGASARWSSNVGTGIGFGGGCGAYAETSLGGLYGYRGNVLGNQATERFPALGPVPGKPNPENNPSKESGNCGGSFGGGALGILGAPSGAGGLVRIWWASSSGNSTWIESGENYV